MAAKTIIQVPIDQDLLQALDLLSRTQGRSRAALIRDACRLYMLHTDEERLEQEYIQGYQRIPEDPALGEAQIAILGHVLPEEHW